MSSDDFVREFLSSASEETKADAKALREWIDERLRVALQEIEDARTEECKGCEAEIMVKPSVAKNGRLYCSWTCRLRYEARGEVVCQHCSALFVPKR